MVVHIVGAGLSRTGTVSMVRALDRLGFRTYHMKDMFSLPGHFDAWHDYYFPLTTTDDPSSSTTSLGDVMDIVERDGFNATMDEPTNLPFQELLERYPNAKVILNLRKDGGTVWADSFLASVYPIPGLMQRVPFRWSSTVTKQSQLLLRIYDELGVSSDPHLTHEQRRDRMADRYETWVQHIRQAVPPHQLLEFHVQDGWEPLCAFLGSGSSSSGPVNEACDEILKSGEPFPHANDGNFVRRIVRIMGAICTLFEALPVLLLVAMVLLAARMYVRRRGHRQQVKTKTY